MNFIAPITRK